MQITIYFYIIFQNEGFAFNPCDTREIMIKSYANILHLIFILKRKREASHHDN